MKSSQQPCLLAPCADAGLVGTLCPQVGLKPKCGLNFFRV